MLLHLCGRKLLLQLQYYPMPSSHFCANHSADDASADDATSTDSRAINDFQPHIFDVTFVGANDSAIATANRSANAPKVGLR